MAWFRKTKKPREAVETRARRGVPEGLWVRCDGCREIIYRKELDNNLRVCPKCGHHGRLDARERIELLLDEAPQSELFADVEPTDPLKFRDSKPYRARLVDYQKRTGRRSAG